MSTNHLNSSSVPGLQKARKFSKKKVLSTCFKTAVKISEQFYFRIAPNTYFWVLIRVSIVLTCFSCSSS